MCKKNYTYFLHSSYILPRRYEQSKLWATIYEQRTTTSHSPNKYNIRTISNYLRKTQLFALKECNIIRRRIINVNYMKEVLMTKLDGQYYIKQ